MHTKIKKRKKMWASGYQARLVWPLTFYCVFSVLSRDVCRQLCSQVPRSIKVLSTLLIVVAVRIYISTQLNYTKPFYSWLRLQHPLN